MLEALISIVGILLTIFFVVGTHEFGHFITARLLSVKVLRFSIGFGKSIFRWHDKSGTEYVFAWIPLGGYVKMLDESEAPVPKDQLHLAYNHQPYYKKFLIVLAGPLTNLICAFAVYWLIFVMGFMTIKPVIGEVTKDSIAYEAGLTPKQQITKIGDTDIRSWMNVVFAFLYKTGDDTQLAVSTKPYPDGKSTTHTMDLAKWKMDDLKPDPLASLGISPYRPSIPNIIGKITPNSPAEKYLKTGDKIVAVKDQKIKDWNDFAKYIYERPNKTFPITLIRNKKKRNVIVTTGEKYTFLSGSHGFIGAGPKFNMPTDLLQRIQYSPIEATTHAFKEVVNFTYLNFLLIGKILVGKLSFQSLGGPITIFSSAGTALNSGFISFLSFLAFLSIAIGVINFLPIPGLDGGHMLIQTIEAIAGKPMPEKVLILFYKLGLVLIFFLLFTSLTNDIMRMF